GPQKHEDRAGAHLARDPDWRGGGFASGRFHRRPAGALADRRRAGVEPPGPDAPRTEVADAARGASAQNAVRGRRRLRAHARGGRPFFQRDPGEDPADRVEGSPEAAPPLPGQETEAVSGDHTLSLSRGPVCY